ncbi:hypothetical protein EJ03DRAFT_372779 [Teratosphaeria nubilosa]|uniref:Protein kinase domain-containing protein n=1 Tax=Teratosphaeria nubilosa TaxID=161662 RepID=A0A6G1LEZ4_9PEZI|nr:hypothetical protein EJ03DRAFT_372779 [Teratosphaeria nubilosa]
MSQAVSPEDADTIQQFYHTNQSLSLTLDINSGAAHTIRAKILKLHQPSTLSCVLTVELLRPKTASRELPAQAILKLYDRRFSDQLRSDEKIAPWSEATEQAFAEFIASGQAAIFVKRLREDDDFEEPAEGWSPAENEAYLHNECGGLFETEVRAYDMMRSLQGKQIPKLYGSVSFPLDPDAPAEPLLTIKGLLLEYIPGPTLSEMIDSVPVSKWQYLVDRAVQIVRDYSLLGIRNKDVRCSNFIINESVPDDDEHRVVMLDFALCTFRDTGQTEAEWGRAKWSQDEEGAVGAVMKTRLAKVGFELEYVPSNQWIEYAPGEDD